MNAEAQTAMGGKQRQHRPPTGADFEERQRAVEEYAAGLRALLNKLERKLIEVAYIATVLDRGLGSVLNCGASYSRERNMKKTIIVGFAILAVSTSGALAKAKGQAKPKAAAAAATTGSAGPFMTNTGSTGPFIGQVSAADRELYQKSQRESGMKK